MWRGRLGRGFPKGDTKAGEEAAQALRRGAGHPFARLAAVRARAYLLLFLVFFRRVAPHMDLLQISDAHVWEIYVETREAWAKNCYMQQCPWHSLPFC